MAVEGAYNEPFGAGGASATPRDGSYGVGTAGSEGYNGYISAAGYLETPTNPNQAFGELLSIQQADKDSHQERTISGAGYVSGVREGKITRNADESLDVTNGTIVTVSYTTGQAQTIVMTNTDIAHIDKKTGQVTIQKPL